ncbi:MAG: hypothetical protein MOGMAGMI_02455 [Candidatus Omnitrophica bacterium]|nr:hypothetical protein [Candidatus Omnitrophota bacterium]
MMQLSLWDQPSGYGTPAIPLKPRQVEAHEAVKRHRAAGIDKQLDLLERLGFDTIHTDWTKGQASKAIDGTPPSDRQLKMLLAYGFDVLRRQWTRAEVAKAFELAEREKRQPDWRRVNGLRGGRR